MSYKPTIAVFDAEKSAVQDSILAINERIDSEFGQSFLSKKAENLYSDKCDEHKVMYERLDSDLSVALDLPNLDAIKPEPSEWGSQGKWNQEGFAVTSPLTEAGSCPADTVAMDAYLVQYDFYDAFARSQVA